MDILEGRRETKGGKGRRRCGGEEAYTPPPVNPSNMHNGYVYVQANT